MKKLNKFFAILVALAMMAMLCVTMAFADPDPDADPDPAPAQVTQSSNPANAVLTKVFDVPAGVTVPNASFKFAFDFQEGPVASATIQNQEIAWTESGLTGEQLKTKYLKNIFNYDDNNVIQAGSVLTQPGEYVYIVTEDESSTFTRTANTAETMTYSEAVYTLRIYVVRDKDANENDILKVKTITVQQGQGGYAELDEDNPDLDTQEEVDAANAGNKVNPDDVQETDDPTPQDPDSGDETTKDLGSDFKFINTYTKTLNDNPGDQIDGAFNLAKTVTGSGNTAAQFPFTVTITVEDPTVLATITNSKLTGTVGTGATARSYDFDFNAQGVATNSNVVLAHGEKLVFATFPAGAKVSVTENLNGSGIQYANSYTAKAAGLATGSVKDAAQETGYIDAQGAITVTNDLDDDDITPTGILISNLPYIALALVAIGGLVAYVVVRRRQDDEA